MKIPVALARLAARRRFGVELGLGRMRRLVMALGDPLAGIPVIHLAGTNGKGSTAALIASALSASGLRTGLYTSPHVQRFNERIQVDGASIDDETLEICLAEVLALDDKATFFEVATAVAFSHFGRVGIDVAVVETGLGGRLDATNVVTPRVTVVTSIARDHTAVLGDTLAAIAKEKAGIFKSGTPSVSARGGSEVEDVLCAEATRRGCELTLEGRDFTWREDVGRLSYASSAAGALVPIEVGLPGAYQLQNAALAWAALDRLADQGIVVDEVARRRGFARARWPGRFEWIDDVLLDGAHNPQGCRALAASLVPDARFSLIFAALDEKKIEAMFDALRSHVAHAVFPAIASDRAVPPSRLATIWGAGGQVAGTTQEALARLRRHSSPILVAGSLYLVGEARALMTGDATPDVGDPSAMGSGPDRANPTKI